MMTIKDLKYKIEKRLQKIKLYNDIYGFQIQPDSKLVNGISRKEIDQLQILFGFDFPWEYREMLLLFSNLDRPTISINPEDENILRIISFINILKIMKNRDGSLRSLMIIKLKRKVF